MADPITATIGAVGSIAGGAIQAGAAGRAASAQERAAREAAAAQERAAAAQRKLNERIYKENTARFQPFYDEGRRAQEAYLYELGLGDQPEGWNALFMTPQGRFALEQGRDAIEAGASYGGGLYSGRAMEALEQYRQNVALADRDSQLNRIGALGQQGQAAAAQQAQAGNVFLQTGVNALGRMGDAQAAGAIGAGNAQAAGAIGVGNAINSGIQNGIGVYQYQRMLDTMAPSQVTPGNTVSGWAPPQGNALRYSSMATPPSNVWPTGGGNAMSLGMRGGRPLSFGY